MAQVSDRLRIAVVGAGISGLVSAYLLSQRHAVTLYERNEYLGGHTNTRVIDRGADNGLAVDTGFIVCNRRNYPHFYRLLERLGVGLRDSDMSFSFYCEQSGLHYAAPRFYDVLRVPSSLLRPGFLAMLLEQRRFAKRALSDLAAGLIGDQSLAEYLRAVGVSTNLVRNYVTPLLAAIWSSPDAGIDDFPALTFVQFFRNHGMLDFRDFPQWQTVIGGSRAYVQAIQRNMTAEVLTGCAVYGVCRDSDGVTVKSTDGAQRRFDRVILAAHADQALAMLSDASTAEQQALAGWRYSTNRTVLHTDTNVMVGRPRSWASWNYRLRAGDRRASPVAVTYYMNRLQGLRAAQHYFVTLNPHASIDPQRVIYQVDYTHPIYTPDSLRSQQAVKQLNGQQHTFFCGAYCGYGFHEDGVNAALEVCKHFGVNL